MDHVIVASLFGVATGFLLPSLASYVRSKLKGNRFENAVKLELDEAKESVQEKMLWFSRDQMQFRQQADERLLVELGGKLLYLGEEEDFAVSLPFWDQNIRDIIEITSASSFDRMCRDVLMLRKFARKFREMKLAFKIGGGDPKQMASACYLDLVEIHVKLTQGKSFVENQQGG
ncbi:MAG TPA: hypothetical protein VGZ48_04950 [Candidatus Acidoferrales bacterium]|jgi:hypothetical protein|nr:hypothetical protein [Candidatus Acidoferrales bacterium]